MPCEAWEAQVLDPWGLRNPAVWAWQSKSHKLRSPSRKVEETQVCDEITLERSSAAKSKAKKFVNTFIYML